jgi:asparagine synthase (glutamine-hydrolysing)
VCGIAGSTLANPEPATRRMLGELVRRGPDDSGVHVDPAGGIAFGARRLSIIDVAGGRQPIGNEDGTVWAVNNGEIYNFESLRAQLAAAGHRFATRCDTEVLVHLYEEYGAALVHAIEGMFAFAIWDSREQRLLLGRDRSGEKPLFLRRSADGLAFASELGALLAAGEAGGAVLDPAAVDEYLVLGHVAAGRSVVAGIEQLAPGTLLDARPGAAPAVTRYWAVPEPLDAADGRPLAELVDETATLLAAAVRSRLVTDVPLGLFLSGGLDSTLVAALAREHGEARTFSVGYATGGCDERSAAAAVARRLGTRHEELVLADGDIGDLAAEVLEGIDQPLADQALLPMHALARAARRSVTVIIGGEGADEHFAGYPRYTWLERAARLGRGAPVLQPVLTRAVAVAAPRRRERVSSLLAGSSAADCNLDWITAGRAGMRAALYGERLREALPSGGLAVADSRFMPGAPGAQAMALDQRLWLPGDVLAKADRAGMANSLEIRTPFLDRSLIEFAASVHATVHAGRGGKALLKGVLERVVPGLEPPAKRGFRVPAADWLRGPLRAALEHCATESRVVRDGWLRREPLERLAREHVSGGADHADLLWPALALSIWLGGPRGRDVT